MKPDTPMPLLDAKGLQKSFTKNGTKVLNGVDIRLYPGESLAILGYSGEGKTTLLQLLGGLLEPDKGAIFFKGLPLPGPGEKLVPGHEDIRLVYQHFGLDHRLSVGQNLRHRMLGFKPEVVEKRSRRLLKWCQLDQLEDQPIELLSGGEKQRLALARALADYPEVLLLDEPFSSIDIPLRLHFKRGLAQFAKEDGFSMILVTHDYQDAFQLANKIMVLHKGSIIRTGTPREIYEDPGHKVVAELLGAINLIKEGKEWIWIKEERIQLKARGKGWQGTIHSKMYLGDFIQYRVMNTKGQELTVMSKDRDYEPGRTVSLEWSDHAIARLQA
jgi:ABC-type Fe3+/spermidine/putrescine transport system ATPase subunit